MTCVHVTCVHVTCVHVTCVHVTCVHVTCVHVTCSVHVHVFGMCLVCVWMCVDVCADTAPCAMNHDCGYEVASTYGVWNGFLVPPSDRLVLTPAAHLLIFSLC